MNILLKHLFYTIIILYYIILFYSILFTNIVTNIIQEK